MEQVPRSRRGQIRQSRVRRSWKLPWQPAAAFSGKAATTATFSQPGEYVLRVVANDWSGDGGRGFQCCWTNAQVKVQVK